MICNAFLQETSESLGLRNEIFDIRERESFSKV